MKVDNLPNSQQYKSKYDEDFENTQTFFEEFAQSMLIFDPLDRPVSIDAEKGDVTSIS